MTDVYLSARQIKDPARPPPQSMNWQRRRCCLLLERSLLKAEKLNVVQIGELVKKP